jgi:2-dehydropantoate 2-reductase
MIIEIDALHKGEETTYSRKGVIHFGDREGKNGEREQTIADFFTRTGVSFKLEENMKRALWYKFMFNTGVNQVTAVLKLPYKTVMNKGSPGEIYEAHLLIEKAMREVITIANAENIDLNEEDIERIFKTINLMDGGSFTSMCQDVLAGRKTEVEMFSLTLLELGKKHRISLPVNEILYLQLRTIEQFW